ncbi:AAC(3) family N-acetyltransferase [Caviibacter abscessus]|uniref:AAC(3) family N-acetyltransferase n=1 Tax=Caviibacter abscessus TaxID=1766719 RepID=UPI0008327605|nr:AAC(3) family N-acetyltransferase [Caviibacter abscessus]
MYDLNAKILMIGTDFETNTSIHLAENFLGRETIIEKSKMKHNEIDKWVEFKNIEVDIYDDYLEIQKLFYDYLSIKPIKVNEAEISCFRLKECVNFSKQYYLDRGKK